MKRKLLLIHLLLFCVLVSAQQLKIHPVPNNILYKYHNDDFTVQVRLTGNEWCDLYEYKVLVDLDKPQEASMVQFDFEGQVDMRIKVNNGIVHEVKVRPIHEQINYTKDGNYIYFTLSKPSKLSLEINGDRLHNLHIFANEIEKNVPDRNDPNVIYFDAGFHTPADSPGNMFRIPSNKTVYLAPGAILKGKLVCNKVENVKIIGRGIILEAERGVEITHSKNIEIDGITVINPNHYTVYGGESSGIRINNLKSFSCRGWSDGIDLMSCSDVNINDIFMRNSDDCIAIYSHRWNFYGDARNYSITNAILWADVAHPINIGLHGDTSVDKNLIENIHFKNIHILEHDEDDRNYQGCMALSVSDHNFVQNITFENVYVENIQEGQLLNLRVLFNEKYSKGKGLGIDNIVFKNIYYSGSGENTSIIEGFSDENIINNIKFENIIINGKKINSLKDMNVKIGKYVNEVTVK
ncbi:glycosyl hydrolase family 28 protein [Dysgonomonas massiliensis]|uniref:glycosyl hydrolase family 28 protein n=1 Tax=Dysgonomonas massiliensis TaxID=2040292 RepID=UPI000C758678|nr:glycosyl hydrolase family 28 protein [Dysgonomonas massiliensis]